MSLRIFVANTKVEAFIALGSACLFSLIHWCVAPLLSQYQTFINDRIFNLIVGFLFFFIALICYSIISKILFNRLNRDVNAYARQSVVDQSTLLMNQLFLSEDIAHLQKYSRVVNNQIDLATNETENGVLNTIAKIRQAISSIDGVVNTLDEEVVFANKLKSALEECLNKTKSLGAEIARYVSKGNGIVNFNTINDLESVSLLVDNLHSALCELSEKVENFSNLSTNSKDAMTTVQDGIMAALVSMQFQDISRQQLEAVKVLVSNFVEHFIQLDESLQKYPPVRISSQTLEEVLENFKDHYVMQQQYDSHNNALGQEVKRSAQSSIELF